MSPDRTFYKRLLTLAVPIILQNLISSSLNLVDVMMVGQLGETTVAATGLANQIFFLFFFLLFGISSGSGVFTAQLWGKGDIPSIRKVLGASLTMGIAGSLFFGFLAVVIPATALSVYTKDQAVIDLGVKYLRIVGPSYILTAITYSYAATLRSTGNVRPPTMINALAIILKTLLNFLLINGNLGFPALGITGAAIATTIARSIECILLLAYTYISRAPTAATPRELFSYKGIFLVNFLKVAFPVVINESLWSLGISTYNSIYAHISTQSIAAVQIASTVENIAFAIFIGISDATGILIGNRIGAHEEEVAYTYARRSLILSTIGAILMGGAIYLLSPYILNIYNVSPEVRQYARSILIVMSTMLWIRVSNMTLIVGVLRSGGDTRFAMFVDGGGMWMIGVPSALLAAYVFHLPVHLVYLVLMSEELFKYAISLWRFRTRKWIRNVSQSVSEI